MKWKVIILLLAVAVVHSKPPKSQKGKNPGGQPELNQITSLQRYLQTGSIHKSLQDATLRIQEHEQILSSISDNPGPSHGLTSEQAGLQYVPLNQEPAGPRKRSVLNENVAALLISHGHVKRENAGELEETPSVKLQKTDDPQPGSSKAIQEQLAANLKEDVGTNRLQDVNDDQLLSGSSTKDINVNTKGLKINDPDDHPQPGPSKIVDEPRYDKYMKEYLSKGFQMKLKRKTDQGQSAYYSVVAEYYSKNKGAWMFKVLERKLPAGPASIPSVVKSLSKQLDPTVQKNLEKNWTPVTRADGKYLEKNLPGDDEDSKYVAIGDIRTVEGMELTLNHIQFGNLMWRRAKSENGESRTMEKWLDWKERSKQLTEKKFEERNNRERKLAEFRIGDDGRNEYLEASVGAKAYGFDGWKTEGEWIKVDDRLLNIIIHITLNLTQHLYFESSEY